jgi:hypothetical protein
MAAEKKVSLPLPTEELALHLANDPIRPRLLVGGLPNQKALNKFLKTISVPSEHWQTAAGSTFGYVNVEVITPAKQSFFAIKVAGKTEVMLQALRDAAHRAGLATATVSKELVTPDDGQLPIVLAQCQGILHNVYASSVPK